MFEILNKRDIGVTLVQNDDEFMDGAVIQQRMHFYCKYLILKRIRHEAPQEKNVEFTILFTIIYLLFSHKR